MVLNYNPQPQLRLRYIGFWGLCNIITTTISTVLAAFFRNRKIRSKIATSGHKLKP
jgi:hypothetical protein